MAAEQVVAQGVVVDDHAAAEVQEQAAGTHLRELGPAEQTGVAGPSVDVQRHGLRLGQQLVEAVTPSGVAQRELVGDVVEQHPHAERLGDDGQLAADVAVPDDAEAAAAHLVRALGRLVPDAVVHQGVLVGQVPRHRDDLGDRELDHAAGVGVGRVEHRDPGGRGRRQVDLVGTDAERSDRQQAVSLGEHLGGDRGLGPDAEQLDAIERGHQLVRVERTLGGADLDPALTEQPLGLRVDVLQQQRSHGSLVWRTRVRCSLTAWWGRGRAPAVKSRNTAVRETFRLRAYGRSEQEQTHVRAAVRACVRAFSAGRGTGSRRARDRSGAGPGSGRR